MTDLLPEHPPLLKPLPLTHPTTAADVLHPNNPIRRIREHPPSSSPTIQVNKRHLSHLRRLHPATDRPQRERVNRGHEIHISPQHLSRSIRVLPHHKHRGLHAGALSEILIVNPPRRRSRVNPRRRSTRPLPLSHHISRRHRRRTNNLIRGQLRQHKSRDTRVTHRDTSELLRPIRDSNGANMAPRTRNIHPHHAPTLHKSKGGTFLTPILPHGKKRGGGRSKGHHAPNARPLMNPTTSPQ